MDELHGRITQGTLEDHFVCTILVENESGDPLGEVVATGIRASGDTCADAIDRAAERAIATARALGYTGTIRAEDLHGDVHISFE